MLRPFQVEDIVEVTQISMEGGYSNWSEGSFEGCLKENYQAWVLVESERIVGFIVFLVGVGELEILNIGTHVTKLRQGLASYLMQHLFEFAKEHQIERIFLEVNQSNIPAIQLYETQGFQIVGLRKNYYSAHTSLNVSSSGDALVLSKVLL